MFDVEIQILSKAIYNDEALGKIIGLEESCFSDARTNTVFRCMQELYNSSQKIDLPSINVLLKKRKSSYNITKFLNDSQRLPFSKSIDFLVSELIETKRKKDLMAYTSDFFKAVKEDDMSQEDFYNKIVAIKDEQYLQSDNFMDFRDFGKSTIQEIFKRIRYLKTGLQSLDEKIVGLFCAQLIIIAGRPSCGKTTIACQLAKQYKTLFFSLEMKREEIYAKMLSSETDIESWKIETRRLDDEEFVKVRDKHQELHQRLDITFFDAGLNYASIVNYINTFVRIKKPELIIIDYLQLIKGAPGENQNIRIGEITGTLKQLAMEHNIPIVLLSQLNRSIEKSNRDPVQSDLRESGNIEQDATLIIFLHDDKFFIVKNRKGRVGKVESIEFQKEHNRFVDILEDSSVVIDTPEEQITMSYIHD